MAFRIWCDTAVPVPDPTPVATNSRPMVFDRAPIRVKFVLPMLTMVYRTPGMNDPPEVVYPVVLGNSWEWTTSRTMG